MCAGIKLKNIYRNTKYLSPSKVRFPISGIQPEIFQYAKNQENIIHNEEENQSIENNRNNTDDRTLTVTVTVLTVPGALPSPGPANRSSPERRWASWGCMCQSPGQQGQREMFWKVRNEGRGRDRKLCHPDSSHPTPQPRPQKPYQKTSAEGRPQHFVSRRTQGLLLLGVVGGSGVEPRA